MNPATAICLNLGGIGFLDKYHISIMGMANFINSDGWIFMMPRSSQRWAPLAIAPIMKTAINSTNPAMNKCGDHLDIVSGRIWATSSITAKPTNSRSTWAKVNFRSPPLAL
jgi:hypothetical protein